MPTKRGRPASRRGGAPEQPGIRATIASLRKFNAAQAVVIGKLESYQRAVAGIGFSYGGERSGYRNGYDAEVAYLRWRCNSLKELIACFESYKRISQNSAGLAGLAMLE